jgi:predicted metalloprotease with PDZ domain
MKPIAWLLVAAATVSCAWPAMAAQPRCSLDLSTCLMEFAKMRDRPWVGVILDQDSTTGAITVLQVAPGGPAARAGMKAGDVMISLEGLPVPEGRKLLAGKAGWKTGKNVHYRIRRGAREMDMPLRLGQLTDEQLAQMIGEHMVEAHLAYAETGASIH